jgi:hypothetical protein
VADSGLYVQFAPKNYNLELLFLIVCVSESEVKAVRTMNRSLSLFGCLALGLQAITLAPSPAASTTASFSEKLRVLRDMLPAQEELSERAGTRLAQWLNWMSCVYGYWRKC